MSFWMIPAVQSRSRLFMCFWPVVSIFVGSAHAETYGIHQPPQPKGVAELPEHVPAPAGELTLHADYWDVQGEQVALYLINRTANTIWLMDSDPNPLVKLEARTGGGRWNRAEAHQSEDRGSGAAGSPPLLLRPEQYCKLMGRFPSEGQRGVIRYVLYASAAFALGEGSKLAALPADVVSNSGLGLFDVGQLELALYDDLAARTSGSFEVLSAIAMDEAGTGTVDARRAAVLSLRRIPEGRTIDLLIELLRDGEPNIRHASIFALAKLSPQMAKAEEIISGLSADPDPETRRVVTLALRSLPAPRAIAILKVKLQDVEPKVRYSAVMSLSKIASESAEASALIEGLFEHAEPGMRKSAIYAIARIPPTERTVALLEESLRDVEHENRYAVVFTLLQLAPRFAPASALLEQLQTDEDPEMRRRAAQAMKKIQRRKDDLQIGLQDSSADEQKH